MPKLNTSFLFFSILASLAGGACAHDSEHGGSIATKAGKGVQAPFDIVHTRISTDGNTAIFHMAVSGKAGASRPTRSGKLAGSSVFSYVWPTSLDPSIVGFDPKAGILAFGVTSHPALHDTPPHHEKRHRDLATHPPH